jgi:hypothetical protein
LSVEGRATIPTAVLRCAGRFEGVRPRVFTTRVLKRTNCRWQLRRYREADVPKPVIAGRNRLVIPGLTGANSYRLPLGVCKYDREVLDEWHRAMGPEGVFTVR